MILHFLELLIPVPGERESRLQCSFFVHSCDAFSIVESQIDPGKEEDDGREGLLILVPGERGSRLQCRFFVQSCGASFSIVASQFDPGKEKDDGREDESQNH